MLYFIAHLIFTFMMSFVEPAQVEVEYYYVETNVIYINDLPRVPVVMKEPNVVRMRVTGYAPLDNKSGMCADDNPTSTSIGHYPSASYAAVDPKRIPYGTKLDVPDYGIVEAGDTGGILRNHEDLCVDLYFDTYDEAIQWGVRYLDVEILE